MNRPASLPMKGRRKMSNRIAEKSNGRPNAAIQERPRRPSNVPHLLPEDDPVLVWEQQERQSTYQLSIQNATARRRHFEGIHVRTLARPNENNEQQHKQQMNESPRPNRPQQGEGDATGC
ncbi:hypothetical protein PGT21_016580 [Puccinia graminis f. sp. tritici]|uniref:Uncharacterized protein n=1 Tax=Puccinia graminis f. sp. tritici TaxID=56615 RepID=A0A5B0LKH6_PUCGR|nr:hypothetical protein PGT21_016580 [Puccinia graminis f. sp. tritici]